MQKRACKRCIVHNGETEQNVGELAHRGVGKSFFQHRFPIGEERSHKYCDKRQTKPCGLHPGSFQKICAKHAEYADGGKHARLYNDGGKNRGSRCRCDRMRCRQPCVHGKHARLYAKTEKHNKSHNQKETAMFCYGGGTKRAVHHCESQRATVPIEEIDAEQRRVCAAQGIK